MKPDLLNENKPISPRKGEIGLNPQTYNKPYPDFGNGARTDYEAQFEFSMYEPYPYVIQSRGGIE